MKKYEELNIKKQTEKSKLIKKNKGTPLNENILYITQYNNLLELSQKKDYETSLGILITKNNKKLYIPKLILPQLFKYYNKNILLFLTKY